MKHWRFFLALLMSAATLLCQEPHIQVQTGHTAQIRSIDINRTRSACITASNDHTLRLWSLDQDQAGALLRVLAGHTSSVVGGLFNPNDANQIISWSLDGTVRLWNLLSDENIIVRPTDKPTCLDVRRGSNVLAVGTRNNQVEFIDANTGDLADKVADFDFQPSMVQYSPSGEYLLVGGNLGQVIVYNVRKRVVIHRASIVGAVVGAVWRSEDQWAVVGVEGVVLTGQLGRNVSQNDLNVRIVSVARYLDDQEVLILGQDGTTIGYNLETKHKRVRVRSNKVRGQSSIALSNNHEMVGGIELRSGGFAIELYNWAGYSSIVADKLRSSIATTVLLLKQQKGLLVGGNDGTLWLWNPEASSSPIEISTNDFDRIETLVMLPDSTHCIIGGFGKHQLGLLNLKTLEIAWHAIRGLTSVRSVAALSQERLIVTDGNTGRVLLLTTGGAILDSWELKSRTVLKIDSNTFASVNERGVTVQVLGKNVPSLNCAFSTDEAIQSAVYDEERNRIVVLTIGGGVYDVVLDSSRTGSNGTQMVHGPSRRSVLASLYFTRKTAYSISPNGDFCTWITNSSDIDRCDRSVRCNARPTAFTVSADETLAVVATQDGTVLLIDVASMKSIAQLFASRRGWAVVSNNAEYDSYSDNLNAILVVRGFEARTLRQMPIGYRNPSLVSDIFKRRSTTSQMGDSKFGEAFMNRPAVVSFVRPGNHKCTGKSAILTYRLMSGYNKIQSVTLTEGARLIYYRSTDASSPIGSEMRSVRVQLKPGQNTFMIQAKAIDGVVSIDTLTLESIETLDRSSQLYALIVGVNSYDDPQRNLKYAVNDALRIEKSLRKTNPTAMFTVLTESNATASAIRRALSQYSERIRAQDRLVIYYAGHGESTTDSLSGDRYHLLPYGSYERDDRLNALSIDTLFADLYKAKASEILVVIDACYSGNFVASRNVKHRFDSSLLNGGGIAVIASTDKDEKATEHPILKGSLLTYLLSEGLGGMAQDTDGDVTVYSLANYVAKRISGLCEQLGLPAQRAVTRIGSSGASMIFRD